MALSRPAVVPTLDVNQTARTAWSVAKQNDGYVFEDPVPFAEYNYGLGWLGDWIAWLNERSEDGAAPALDLTVKGVDLATAGNAGAYIARGGDASDASGVGGTALMRAGNSGSAQAGPIAEVRGGEGGTTGGTARLVSGLGGGGAGGGAAIISAVGSVAAGTGATASVVGGSGVGTDKNGGAAFMQSGNATGTGTAGQLSLLGGTGIDGNGGSFIFTAGSSTNGTGGDITTTGGASAGGLRGGNVSYVGGAGSAGSAGGSASLIGGAGDTGGNVIITGGEGGVGGIGTRAGDVTVTTGSANASNTPAGNLVLTCGSGDGTHVGATASLSSGDGVGVDQNAGALTLATGQSTGTGSGSIRMQVTGIGGSGSSLNSVTTQAEINYQGMIIGGTISNFIGDGLHIFKSDVVGAPMSADADNLVIEENGNSGISIISGGTSTGRIFFGDNAAQLGHIAYVHTTDQLILGTNGSDRVFVDSTGRVGIGVAPPAVSGLMLGISQGINNTPTIMRLSQTDPSYPSQTDLARWEVEGSDTGGAAEVNAYMAVYQDGAVASMGFRWFVGGGGAPTEAMRISSNGRLVMGDITADALAHFQSDSATDTMKVYRETTNTNANVFVLYSDVTATETLHLAIVGDGDVFNTNGFYGTISDRRKKKAIGDFSLKDAANGNVELSACDALKGIRVRKFLLNQDDDNGDLRYGVVAQEVPEYLSKQLVREMEDNTLSFNYAGLPIFNTKAIQELIDEVTSLKTRVAALEAA